MGVLGCDLTLDRGCIMRRLATLAVVAALMSPTVASGQYTFGDWARDQGYSPGDVMPSKVWADGAGIDSLDGIGEFDWNTTPTIELSLGFNVLSSIESGAFSGLTSLWYLNLEENHQLSTIQPGAFSGLTSLLDLQLIWCQLSSIESGVFSGMPNLTDIHLWNNQLSSIVTGAFSELTNLEELDLQYNMPLTELNLAEADFSSLINFNVAENVNIASVSLKNAVVNQSSLAALLDGGEGSQFGEQMGIGELDGISELDLSSVDFAEITDLEPLYVMDDLTDLWLVDTENLDAIDLDGLLDNLQTIEGTDVEGILYMTQANFDAFNAAGGGGANRMARRARTPRRIRSRAGAWRSESRWRSEWIRRRSVCRCPAEWTILA